MNESRWQPYPAYRDSNVHWIDKIPAHWETRRLKYAAAEVGMKISEKPESVLYLGLENIESGTGRLLLGESADEIVSTVVAFKEGDVLFGKLRPYLAKVVHADFEGVGTTELLVLRPAGRTDGRFLFYHLLTSGFIDTVNSLTYGTKMPRANSEQVRNLLVALPPLPEQRAIAAFLDHETAKIDALVAKQERLIALLLEKRATLISHAVTKGLNPNVPMKDSGIPWLGQVPAHWDLLKLRRVIVEFVDYRGKTPEKATEGIPLITARNIKNGTINFDLSQEFIREDDYDSWMVRGLPRIGDVLVTTEAPLGESAQVIDTKIALAQRIILLKTDMKRVTNDYLKYHFAAGSGQGELWSHATGSTAVGIKAYHLKDTLMTVPPIEEQEAITARLDHETAKVEALTAKAQQMIGRLQEYRTALISAAVTGKIDVRDEV